MRKWNKIVIAGGTGFLGQLLIKYLSHEVDEIIVLTRKHHLDCESVKHVKWDGKQLGYWTKYLEGAEAIINLNGKSVDCRYNDSNKQKIYNTRIDATHAIGQAILQCINPPKIWINASSATIYRHSLNEPMDEDHGEIGKGFSVDVCKKWEEAFNFYKLSDTRKVILRTAIVLGENGAFQVMKHLTNLGLGGKMGKGNQMVSWLHEKDFVGIIRFCLEHRVEGIYNASSPNPVTNTTFQKHLRQSLNIWFGLPIPSWLLEIGALIRRTETELVLKSRYVVPERLLEKGYQFSYSDVAGAIDDLIKK